MLPLKNGIGITDLDPAKIEATKKLQARLGDKAPDGKFGPGTEALVIEFQKKSGLASDGVVGQGTWDKLFGIQKTQPPTPTAPKGTFEFDFDAVKLAALLRRNPKASEWFDSVVEVLPKVEIKSVLRAGMFFAQCGHESNDFSTLQENLNYSAQGLRKTFAKYYKTDEDAEAHAKKPEKIANRVYGGRMGNGLEASGEGYKFRGRGIIQLTGKDNYTRCSKAMFGDDRLVQNPEVVLEKEMALRTACWFWGDRKVNEPADKGDVKESTRRVNGGYIGLEDREKHYNEAVIILKGL